jgi:hypothetical protein
MLGYQLTLTTLFLYILSHFRCFFTPAIDLLKVHIHEMSGQLHGINVGSTCNMMLVVVLFFIPESVNCFFTVHPSAVGKLYEINGHTVQLSLNQLRFILPIRV